MANGKRLYSSTIVNMYILQEAEPMALRSQLDHSMGWVALIRVPHVRQ